MTNAIVKIQKCVVMRSGSEFLVSEDTAKKIEAQIVNQSGHKFLQLSEINRTINTADIVEVLTMEQLDERNRLKRKEWKCIEGNWHEPRQKCFCAQDKAKERARIVREQEMAEQNKPMTPEQEANMKKNFAETRKFLEKKGILAKRMTVK